MTPAGDIECELHFIERLPQLSGRDSTKHGIALVAKRYPPNPRRWHHSGSRSILDRQIRNEEARFRGHSRTPILRRQDNRTAPLVARDRRTRTSSQYDIGTCDSCARN